MCGWRPGDPAWSALSAPLSPRETPGPGPSLHEEPSEEPSRYTKKHGDNKNAGTEEGVVNVADGEGIHVLHDDNFPTIRNTRDVSVVVGGSEKHSFS